MKQPLSPRDVFLGHTLFVAPPQLSSLLHCTAGFPTSTLFLPWSKPQILCVLLPAFRPVPPWDRAEPLQSSSTISTDLAATSKLQWQSRRAAPCCLSTMQSSLALTYGADTSSCFIQVQLHGMAAPSFQSEHHGSQYLLAEAVPGLFHFFSLSCDRHLPFRNDQLLLSDP